MGRTERASGRERVHTGPGQAVDARHLDRLGLAERWQDRGHTLGEHRLAGPRRAAQEHAVGTRGGDHDRPNRVLLSADVAEVGGRERGGVRSRLSSRSHARAVARSIREGIAGAAAQHAHGGGEPLDRDHFEAVDEQRLTSAAAG